MGSAGAEALRAAGGCSALDKGWLGAPGWRQMVQKPSTVIAYILSEQMAFTLCCCINTSGHLDLKDNIRERQHRDLTGSSVPGSTCSSKS